MSRFYVLLYKKVSSRFEITYYTEANVIYLNKYSVELMVAN